MRSHTMDLCLASASVIDPAYSIGRVAEPEHMKQVLQLGEQRSITSDWW